MEKPAILVVDDEEDILELVKLHLSQEGFKVILAMTGEQALTLVETGPPSLVVLDLMLPGVDGLEVCKRLKAGPRTRQIPILMLTAKGEEADIVRGLELGADDYMTKPFSGKVLVARIHRILRRQRGETDREQVVEVRGLVVDPIRHEVLIDGKPVSMTATEFKILHMLAVQPGRVFTRCQIVDTIHGGDYLVTDRAVDVQIVSLRRKLGPNAKYIETVRGVGYRFSD